MALALALDSKFRPGHGYRPYAGKDKLDILSLPANVGIHGKDGFRLWLERRLCILAKKNPPRGSAIISLSAHREEREGPIAKRWEGEVGLLGDSPTSPRPSPPPRAEREIGKNVSV